jgi:hypothetical protein
MKPWPLWGVVLTDWINPYVVSLSILPARKSLFVSPTE